MTNQTNSGDIKSKIDELERILDEYDKKFLLHKIVVNSEVEKILELKQDELKVLPRESCFTYAFLLTEFGIAVQKEHNRQNAKQKWASHNLGIVVAQQQSNYGDKYTKAEVRKDMIIADNEYAKALHEVIVKSDCNIEELNFLSSRINALGEILREYGKSKRE